VPAVPSELQCHRRNRQAAGDAAIGAVFLVVSHIDDEGHLVDDGRVPIPIRLGNVADPTLSDGLPGIL
jgi:hypothetical protein